MYSINLRNEEIKKMNIVIFIILNIINPFSADLFKVDSSMFKLGRLYFQVIGFLEYSL